jgi:hypothetical protein
MRIALAVMLAVFAVVPAVFAQVPDSVQTPESLQTMEAPPMVIADPPPPGPEQVREQERQMRVFMQSNARTGRIASNTNVAGTNGELLLDSTTLGSGILLRAFTSTPMVFTQLGTTTSGSSFRVVDSSGATLFNVRGDGFTSAGPVYDAGRLTSLSYKAGGRAIYAYQNNAPSVTASPQQADFGIVADALINPASGVSAASITGLQTQAVNQGAGSVSTAAGGRFFAGVYSGTAGTVSNAYGITTLITTGAGTVTNGFGVHIGEVDAVNAYGLYQVGSTDTNYFAGRVGLGTASPQNPLHVVGSGAEPMVRVASSGAYNQQIAASVELAGKYESTNASYTGLARLLASKLNTTSGDRSGKLTINVSNAAGTEVKAVEITPRLSGSTYVADAAFTGRVTGADIAAHYQDLAEWVPSREDLEPGTVVVLDLTVANSIIASNAAYATTVAGVVSARPGIILGEAGDDKEQIATTGRVRVKVDASNGPIRIGDLLVAGNRAGHAMKSQPVDLGGVLMHRPGTILGKALEPLESGAGEILVLLSLQ